MSLPYNRALCRLFLDELADLAPPRSYYGLAHKLLTPPDAKGRVTRIDHFCWTRTPASEVERLLYGVAETNNDYRWLAGFPSWREAARHLVGSWLPLEVMVRLVVCDTPPTYEDGRHRGGRLDDLSAVVGLLVDVDLYRPEQPDRNYPDLDTALGVIEDYSPSFTLQCGPGLPTGWLFTEPQDPFEADQLGLDLVNDIGSRFEALGYTFDSPNAVGGWLRLPGTWSVRRQALVVPLHIGARIDAVELGDLVPIGPRRPSYSSRYPDPDDPWNVGLPARDAL
jgi:hypothetical protein